MIVLVNYGPVLAKAGRQPELLRRFLCVLGLGAEQEIICTFLRRCKLYLYRVLTFSLTYVEAGAGGPDVAIMPGDHCVLNNFG